jgi:DNA polymerase I
VVRLLRNQGMRMLMSHGGKVTEPIGFDLETRSADQLFLAPRGEFIKIAGYTDGNDVAFTTDMDLLIKQLDAAPWNYSHGGFTFDLLALAYHHGSPEWWDEITRKSVCTEILDRLDYPPMARDTGGSNDKYNLDAVASRRGVAGKTGSIAEIAKKHDGYDNIPADDPEYREYLKGDVNSIRSLIRELPNSPLVRGKGFEYAAREHRVASLNGRMTLNGFRVNVPLNEERIAQGEERKHQALISLRDEFDLPLGRFEWSGRGNDKVETWVDFGNPLASLEGRKWLINVWKAYGVLNPPRTDTGQLSVKAEHLKPIAESPVSHPDLRYLLHLMMIVTTTRTVYQTVADHLVGDRVHPLIVMRQSSGRSSVTDPGLTVFGKRGGRHVERDIFLPEEGHVLLSADLSQVDMRAVAGHCQDPAYMRLFEPGNDLHSEIAAQVFGEMPRDAHGHHPRRQDAKAIGHGANYGLGANKMIERGFDPEVVETFFSQMRKRFPRLISWQNEVRDVAKSGQLLDNGFGRMMRPDPIRAYTQGPALIGQGAASDIMKKALLRLPPEFRPFLRVTVHDEVVISAQEKDAEEIAREVKKAMTFEFRGVPILCDVSAPGKSWGEVSAK